MKQNGIDKKIFYDGDVWRVINTGVQRDGQTYCHLASTTRFIVQKNGNVPRQIGDFINTTLLQQEVPHEDPLHCL